MWRTALRSQDVSTGWSSSVFVPTSRNASLSPWRKTPSGERPLRLEYEPLLRLSRPAASRRCGASSASAAMAIRAPGARSFVNSTIARTSCSVREGPTTNATPFSVAKASKAATASSGETVAPFIVWSKLPYRSISLKLYRPLTQQSPPVGASGSSRLVVMRTIRDLPRSRFISSSHPTGQDMQVVLIITGSSR